MKLMLFFVFLCFFSFSLCFCSDSEHEEIPEKSAFLCRSGLRSGVLRKKEEQPEKLVNLKKNKSKSKQKNEKNTAVSDLSMNYYTKYCLTDRCLKNRFWKDEDGVIYNMKDAHSRQALAQKGKKAYEIAKAEHEKKSEQHPDE